MYINKNDNHTPFLVIHDVKNDYSSLSDEETKIKFLTDSQSLD
jgi:hypothetical protein